MNTVRYGIIGIGNMGTQHSTYLHAGEINGAELTAVCDLKQERLDWAKSKFEGVATFTDYKEMLAKEKLRPTIISESAGTQSDDALIMKKYYMENILVVEKNMVLI